MAAIKAPAFKPSRAFQAEFEKAKKDGLNDTEYEKLHDLAAKEIQKSTKPQALAALYTGEFKGWQAKGLIKQDPKLSADTSAWVFKAVADQKSIADGSKYLKANAAQLIAKYPNLKDVDFKKTGLADFGDYSYMNLVDKKGKTIFGNDPRVATIRQILGSPFKTVVIGAYEEQ